MMLSASKSDIVKYRIYLIEYLFAKVFPECSRKVSKCYNPFYYSDPVYTFRDSTVYGIALNSLLFAGSHINRLT